STTTDVSILLKKLKQEKVDGIVLDLRRNGGGLLNHATDITGLFVDKGPVVAARNAAGKLQVLGDNDAGVAFGGEVVVLVDRFSASASEILAGALQDYGRALIVGDISTHGKGTVQSLVQLSPYLKAAETPSPVNPGALKVTIRKFYRASGESTQLEGVKPDIILPSVNNEADVGEKSLDHPLPHDYVPPAEHEKLNRVAPFVAELKKRSDARIATNRDFAYVREDIEQYKKVKDEKSVSLNEEKRRKEKEEAETRTNARKKELAARPEANEKVYELTLKLAALPGLPPPMVKTNLAKASPSGSGDKSLITFHPTATNSVAVTASANTTFVESGEIKSGIKSKGITIVTGASTNQTASVSADGKKRSKDDDDEDASTDNVSLPDVTFEEARRILVDYIKLFAGREQLTTVRNAVAGAPTR
ncbi:MAG TPA: carboxy terminal-processing peptidase, partial [Verrucomicrobiae bacterium]